MKKLKFTNFGILAAPFIASFALIGFTACENEGEDEMEDAAEEVGDAVEEATDE